MEGASFLCRKHPFQVLKGFPDTSNWSETPVGDTKHTGEIISFGFPIPQEELENVAGVRDTWPTSLGLLP